MLIFYATDNNILMVSLPNLTTNQLITQATDENIFLSNQNVQQPEN